MEDGDFIKTWLRIGLIVILVLCTIVSRQIVKLIQNVRLMKMAKRMFYYFVGLVVLSIVAAALDRYLATEIRWFSAALSYIFYLWILRLLIGLYRRLKQKEYLDSHSTGPVIRNPKYIDKGRVSSLFDGLLDELNVTIKKTDNLEREMASKL